MGGELTMTTMAMIAKVGGELTLSTMAMIVKVGGELTSNLFFNYAYAYKTVIFRCLLITNNQELCRLIGCTPNI